MRTKGSIKGRTYSSYFRAGGKRFVVFVILLCLAAQLATSGCDYFIALWVNMEERKNRNVSPFFRHHFACQRDLIRSNLLVELGFLF